ncbi:amidohydrolase family protein [Tropicimonas sp. IMCC34043]|uniref:metal-dependent hydrolase family protein n=1 Tax=Tropicimonas sp. IMCC34043 TaxID=2248760 RepID=UPI000E254343|nr:amidohydrolase family protein [Tropicimonas sp. IMCC34043]
MNSFKCLFAALATAITVPAAAQQSAPEPKTLFTNVNVFDGMSEALTENVNVLVEGNLIKLVSAEAIAADGATVIDGGGRTLMPGLSDCHWHVVQANTTNNVLLASGLDYFTLVAAAGARDTLMRGFTTVRDMGGPVFGLKRAIDEGLYEGPRIYPSGALITQTSGHADFRNPIEVPRGLGRDLTPQEQFGLMAVTDGVPAVMQRVRENLMKGASQIKLTAGGGVASPSDPLDVSQFVGDELKAAVEVAETWNTYVAVHAYTPKAIQAALRAGVKSIEHGQLLDEETAKMIAENSAVLCLQPFLDDQDAIQFPPGSFQEQKYQQMISGTDNAYELAKKYGIKAGFGTDSQNDPELTRRQGAQLAKLTRWYEPAEVLRIGTSLNQEIFKMSGPRDPYPGKNGVVEEGALADLLLVDGNPLENIQLIADPWKNFLVIMKDGKIYKNTVK